MGNNKSSLIYAGINSSSNYSNKYLHWTTLLSMDQDLCGGTVKVTNAVFDGIDIKDCPSLCVMVNGDNLLL
ncbi:hypothetical protein HUJ04_001401 [Dendroctonus ponderosae]|nr:hypothetical protein HUJ04_001401 [Dendroctonus ponderosae]